jgi:hypothetical protein
LFPLLPFGTLARMGDDLELVGEITDVEVIAANLPD